MTGRAAAYWICQVVGWGLYAAMGMSLASFYVGWRLPVVVGFGLFWAYSIGLTHGMRSVMQQRQWLQLPARAVVPRLLGAVVVVGTIDTAIMVVVGQLLETALGPYPAPRLTLSAWVGITGVVGLWTAIYAAVSAMRRYQEAQRKTLELQLAVKEAELRALEAQVHPHFLFNCLNTIRGMVGEDPAAARDMITRLANLLRYSLQRDRGHTVALEQELEIVRDYLALEGARLEERLRVEWAVVPEAASVRVPAMLLQTLVENAVKHGVARRANGGEVRIRAQVSAGQLQLEVRNPGQLEAPAGNGTLVGLHNTGERLRLLYGANAALCVRNDGADAVVAEVRIPVGGNGQ